MKNRFKSLLSLLAIFGVIAVTAPAMTSCEGTTNKDADTETVEGDVDADADAATAEDAEGTEKCGGEDKCGGEGKCGEAETTDEVVEDVTDAVDPADNNKRGDVIEEVKEEVEKVVDEVDPAKNNARKK